MRLRPLITRITWLEIPGGGSRRPLWHSSYHDISHLFLVEVVYSCHHVPRPHRRRHRYRAIRSSCLVPQAESPAGRQADYRDGKPRRLSVIGKGEKALLRVNKMLWPPLFPLNKAPCPPLCPPLRGHDNERPVAAHQMIHQRSKIDQYDRGPPVFEAKPAGRVQDLHSSHVSSGHPDRQRGAGGFARLRTQIRSTGSDSSLSSAIL
jgi:hypothetical protein